MSQGETIAQELQAGWRVRVGVIFFVLAWVCPLFIPLVTASGLSTAWKTTLSTLLLVGGPEVFAFASIAVLGRPGFNYLKARALGFLKRHGPPREVGRTRYYVGIGMLVSISIFNWIVFYVPDLLPAYSERRVSVNLVVDFTFVASFFVLGGGFWDKFRALFIYDAKALIPARKPA